MIRVESETEEESATEEEILVYADFSQSVNIDKYDNIHILGIDKKNPIVQLDNTFYKGTYINPLGTYMFFEEDSSPQSSDPVFDKLPEKNVKYICKTRKAIKVEHGYITPKDGTASQNEQNESNESQDDAIKAITFKSLQEALDKFKQDWAANDKSSTAQ